MNRTTKFIVSAVAVVALLFTTNANAQNLGVGLNLGIPTNDAYSFAVGADARLQFDVSKQVSIPVTAGYTHFIGKDLTNSIKVSDYGYIPLKTGVKFFLNETGSGPYALAEVGAAFGVTENSGTHFVYAPAIGYSWSNGLDLGVKYEGVPVDGGTVGQVALRVAYGFKL